VHVCDVNKMLTACTLHLPSNSLSSGDQSAKSHSMTHCTPQVVLRKGGIDEPAFALPASRFLLFPTSFHSGADLVKPLAAARYEEVGFSCALCAGKGNLVLLAVWSPAKFLTRSGQL